MTTSYNMPWLSSTILPIISYLGILMTVVPLQNITDSVVLEIKCCFLFLKFSLDRYLDLHIANADPRRKI